MIQMTEEAGAALSTQLSEEEVGAGVAFKLTQQDQGIALGKAERDSGDIQLDKDGTPVLYVPEVLADNLDGFTVDVQPAPDDRGLQLVLRPS